MTSVVEDTAMGSGLRRWAGAIGTLASVGATGCATGPDPEVVRAQAAVQEARADPTVAEYAPAGLRDAEQALVQVEQAQREGLDDEEVDHLAYLAEQKAAIAENQAIEQRSQEQLLQQLRAERTDRGLVVTLEDVLFEVNGADLQPGAQVELLRLVEYLKRNPDRNILIEGHTDSTGSSEYNLQLSQLRAQSVESYMVGNGVPPDRIRAIGYGETRPEAPNDSATGRQQNRRVEIVVLDAGEPFAEVVGGLSAAEFGLRSISVTHTSHLLFLRGGESNRERDRRQVSVANLDHGGSDHNP
jgi:outer membrane protein OmpA-like peptidoglycan-associated protein